jgi:hypothetical protein
MIKMLFLMIIGVASTVLLAYSDSDLDGVADSIDKCPNTPFMDLVDINGCPKKRLSIKKSNKPHYDVIVGANYSGSNFSSLNQTDTYSTSLQIDYYYKNYSLQASTSYYDTEGNGYSESGMNDSFIGAAYSMKPKKNLHLRVGLGALLPTYDTSLNNNNIDYTASLNLSYAFGKYSLFGGYIYTMINDDDTNVYVNGTVVEYTYQNTNAISIGTGCYLTNKLYLSAAYNSADSVYKGVSDVETLSVYAYSNLNRNWFITLFYAYGLSDSASDNALSLKLGYYF